MNETPHILVVDDEPGIRKMLARYLGRQGYRVSTAADGIAMRKILKEDSADLVILDLVMPGEDGLTLTRQLRVESDTAVIILTQKSEMVDKVVGLEMGADDYMPKPFNVRELHARVKSVLRRVKAPADGHSMQEKQDIVYRFAGWQLDQTNRELTSPQGRATLLTKGEFKLLIAFIQNPNRLMTRDELTAMTLERAWTPFDRGIDVQVGRLRRKIEADPQEPALIKTVRGGGYIFAAQVETETIQRK